MQRLLPPEVMVDRVLLRQGVQDLAQEERRMIRSSFHFCR
jgi:hypothetical protein